MPATPVAGIIVCIHMKHWFIILSFLVISMPGKTQSYTFEWVGKTKLKDMVYPGQKYILKQYCQPKADSIAANGKITFSSASIEGIKDVELSYLIKDTILLSTEMTTRDKENSVLLNDRLTYITGGAAPFIQYGKGKTLYKVYLFKREEQEYLLYYDYAINFKYAHILIVPKK